jgi:hypothetical protein
MSGTTFGIDYLVLAHKNPKQVARLVQRLDDDQSHVHIHVDARFPQAPFKRALDGLALKHPPSWIKPGKSPHGDFGLVRVTLRGLGDIIERSTKSGYVILLSGQDYPIKPRPYIREFLECSYGKNFILCHKMPAYWETHLGMSRVEKKFFRFRGHRRVFPPESPPRTLGGKFFLQLQRLYFARPAKLPVGLTVYRGAQWWCLTHEAVKYILDYVARTPDINRYFRFALSANELYFQTILASAPGLGETIVSDNDLHYVVWNTPKPPPPAILKSSDLPDLERTDKLFARKFDSEIDNEILDLVDNRILDG